MFQLHPQLIRDTVFVGDLPLCRVLLMNNRLFPWLILVPRLENASEIIDLSSAERHLLMDEIGLVSEQVKYLYQPDKLNVAALGNQVPQLHVHVIARYRTDPAWPNPVWGNGTEAYPGEEAEYQVTGLQLGLGLIARA